MSEGFLYIATGERYVEEATYSASTVREAMPDSNISIVTDRELEDAVFDDVIPAEPVYSTKVKPSNMKKYPYDKTIFLDTEVHVDDDISELFDLLDVFDVLCSPKQDYHVRETYPDDIPLCYPEYNTGVIGLRSCDAVDDLLAAWAEHYDEDDVHDQVAFRTAMYRSSVRYHQLPIEYNVRHRPGLLTSKAKVFHIRPKYMHIPSEKYESYVQNMKRKLNESPDRLRTYHTSGYYSDITVKEYYRPMDGNYSPTLREKLRYGYHRLHTAYEYYGLTGTLAKASSKIRNRLRSS